MNILVWLKKDNKEFYHFYENVKKVYESDYIENLYEILLHDGLISDYKIEQIPLEAIIMEDVLYRLEDYTGTIRIIKEDN